MNIFIYITGFASLLGLILQLKDVFPKYRNLRKNILLVVLGTFIGSLLGGLRIVQIDLFTQQSPTQIIALIIGIGSCIIIGILTIGIILIKDTKKHEIFFGSLALILLFFDILNYL